MCKCEYFYVMNINERFQEVISLEYGGNKRAFANAVGISPTVVENVVGSRKGKPSYDVLEKVCANANVSPDWLLTGNGPMLKPEESAPSAPVINYNRTGAPYYNVDFIGGFDAVINDQTATPDYFIDFAPFNKPGVVWCNITGHSMEPELNNGDIIAMREVTSPIQYLPAGEIYGIVTDEYRTVKRLRMSQQQGFVVLIPTNKSPEYTEQEIPVSMIRKVFAVLGSVHRLF